MEVHGAHARLANGDLEWRKEKKKSLISVYLLHFEETKYVKGTLAEPCDVKTYDQT